MTLQQFRPYEPMISTPTFAAALCWCLCAAAPPSASAPSLSVAAGPPASVRSAYAPRPVELQGVGQRMTSCVPLWFPADGGPSQRRWLQGGKVRVNPGKDLVLVLTGSKRKPKHGHSVSYCGPQEDSTVSISVSPMEYYYI